MALIRRSHEVSCQCGQPLARYRKAGKGRLVKMFFSRIALDRAGVFLTEPPPQLGDPIFCPKCRKRVATVQVISGKYAAKLNRGAVQPL